MASNILFLPFRKATNLQLSDAIKQYISTKYDQHPDMFKQDLEVIDALRKDAIHVREPHTTGIRKISAYAGQLSWLGIGVEFSWYPALGYNIDRLVVENNLKFELANVMFNLAALYSQLAMSANRASADGLKIACNNFSLAAGVLKHLKEEIIPELRTSPPEDMDDDTLECLQSLMLAQAQECFWARARGNGTKDALVAKLAAKVSDLYSQASDWGMKSNSISSEWLHHSSVKHHHFAAAAQYRMACDCLEKRKYGEEVARLADSIVCANEGIKEIKYVNKAVASELQLLKSTVTECLKRAEKDNDLIYLDPVPPKNELKRLERASMANPIIPKEVSEPMTFLGDHKEFGPPLFSKLVPFAVHVAASIYEERRDRIVNNNIIDELEILTTRIHDTLRSLNLPGSLQALEKPLDAIGRINRSFSDAAKLKASDEAIFLEAKELLQSEASENDRLLRKFGSDRWARLDSRSASPKLYTQVDEIEGYFKSAANSDQVVIVKFREYESILQILTSSDRDIGNFVPSSRRVTIPPNLEGEVSKLRNSLNEISRLESRRRRKIESLREKTKKDDINHSILAETARLEREYPATPVVPAHFEDFFERRLSHTYDADLTSLKTESEEQEKLLQQLEIANTSFIKARAGDTSTREREQALQKLEMAYYKYKEIVNNVDGGRKFYNDLAKIVGRFRDGCKAFVQDRREEARRMEADLSMPLKPMSSLSLHHPQPGVGGGGIGGHHAPPPPQPLIPVQMQGGEIPSPRRELSPIQAPVPQRASLQSAFSNSVNMGGGGGATWNPELGIKFGGGAAGGGENAPAPQTQAQPKQTTWDPSAGLRFG
ncbi:BRO1-like domain-containing protein [Botrytis cinerea]